VTSTIREVTLRKVKNLVKLFLLVSAVCVYYIHTHVVFLCNYLLCIEIMRGFIYDFSQRKLFLFLG
jgi:hypothetical protein